MTAAADQPCPARLFRCCGEGTLRCEKPAGHDGNHYSSERLDRVTVAVTEW